MPNFRNPFRFWSKSYAEGTRTWDPTPSARCDKSIRRSHDERALPKKGVWNVSGTLWIVYAAGRTTIRTVPDTFFGQSPTSALRKREWPLYRPPRETSRG